EPVIIFLLVMGGQGAAAATVVSQLSSCGYVLRFLSGLRPGVRIAFVVYALRIIESCLALRIRPVCIISVVNVMIIAMNAVLQRYGGPERGDLLITCATIVQSFMLVVTMPLGGISGGTQTILGFNYGACRTQRVLMAQRHIFLLCAGYTALMFV